MPTLGTDEGIIHKIIAGFPTNGVTLRFTFIETAAIPTDNIAYIYGTFDGTGEARQLLAFRGDGVVIVVVAGILYLGTWVPSPGSARIGQLTVDAFGIPSAFLDGVAIPLVPSGPASVVVVPDSVIVSIMNEDETGPGAIDCLFLATEVLPPTHQFCCASGELC